MTKTFYITMTKGNDPITIFWDNSHCERDECAHTACIDTAGYLNLLTYIKQQRYLQTVSVNGHIEKKFLVWSV